MRVHGGSVLNRHPLHGGARHRQGQTQLRRPQPFRVNEARRVLELGMELRRAAFEHAKGEQPHKSSIVHVPKRREMGATLGNACGARTCTHATVMKAWMAWTARNVVLMAPSGRLSRASRAHAQAILSSGDEKAAIRLSDRSASSHTELSIRCAGTPICSACMKESVASCACRTCVRSHARGRRNIQGAPSPRAVM